MQARFPIGTTFTLKEKLNVVTDIHTTYNSKMEVVKITYIAVHDFMGQTVVVSDIVDATIAKNLVLSIEDCIKGMRKFVHEQAKSGIQEIAWENIDVYFSKKLTNANFLDSYIGIIDLFVENCENLGINHFYWQKIKTVLGVSK
jgi:hypothetical protein